MDKIKIIHDTEGDTLTVWFSEPSREYICEETSDEVIIMKDKKGNVVGFELLHYKPADKEAGLNVETLIHSGEATAA